MGRIVASVQSIIVDAAAMERGCRILPGHWHEGRLALPRQPFTSHAATAALRGLQ
jgi:hypothetical protein